jgi:hypothetical protein
MPILNITANTVYQPPCEPVVCNPVVPCETVCIAINRPVVQVCLDDFVQTLKGYATYKPEKRRVAAPDVALNDAIQATLQDFTRHTWLLQRRASITTVAGKRDYEITPVENEQIHLIKSVCVNGNCIKFKDNQCCENCNCGDIHGWNFEQPNRIVFDSADCGNSKIEVNYIAMAVRNACEIDKRILDYYSDAIVQGAASRLLTMPGWEWTAPAFGLNSQKKYDKLLAEAKIDVWRKFSTHKQLAIRPRYGRC